MILDDPWSILTLDNKNHQIFLLYYILLEDVVIVSEEEETEVLEEVEAPKSKETKPKKGPKIDISGENKLHLSDEQMAEIMKIIEAEDAKDAAAEKQEL